ncbi:MAG: hypothetical protein DRO88_02505 [Promethearchaeia archaeon]|nr:MAG: hypothetical protein DRO88_02505 [Candidatus Lokiarchaeia archaeon]
MAITATLSNHFKYMQATKKIDFEADTFKIILLDSTFAFDPDAHATLANVTAHQLATGNGYTQNDKALAGVTVLEDDSNDRVSVTWTNATWTASGGSIGPTGAAIIYDDSTTDDTVVGCIDFGTDYTIADGSSLQFQNLAFNGN